MDASLRTHPYARRPIGVGVDEIAWDDVRASPVAPAARRCVRYMQAIETHTVIYLRELLHTRVIEDAEVTSFLARWFHDEIGHGLALERFLAAAGETVVHRALLRVSASKRLEALGISAVSWLWPDFLAMHMTWGALNEISALRAYQRLARRAGHPVLAELLARIARDESHHFAFYFDQAERRLRRRGTARVTRWFVDHFWAPVGSGVQPAAETRFVAEYLFADADGRQALSTADDIISRLPGMEGARPLASWLERNVGQPRAAAGELVLGGTAATERGVFSDPGATPSSRKL